MIKSGDSKEIRLKEFSYALERMESLKSGNELTNKIVEILVTQIHSKGDSVPEIESINTFLTTISFAVEDLFNNTYGVKRIIDYDEVWDYSLKQRYRNNLFLGGFVGYDDSPRRGKNGIIIDNATPDKFRDNMIRLLIKAERNHCEYVFINAWNEWGEGNYVEPDTKYGHGFLDAIRKTIKNV